MVTLANPLRSERNVSVRIGRRLLALHDRLSGPPTSLRERTRARLAQAEFIVRGGSMLI